MQEHFAWSRLLSKSWLGTAYQMDIMGVLKGSNQLCDIWVIRHQVEDLHLTHNILHVFLCSI